MKNVKKTTGLMLVILLAMLLCIPVSAAKLSTTTINLEVGKTKTLKLKGVNSKSKVKWKSSNDKIAKVSSAGKVTAISKGDCTVTATYEKKKYKCKITVSGINVCNTSASKLLSYLKQYGLCVDDKVVYNKKTDPNNQIGSPNGYHSKCDFYNWKYCDKYCTIEVFSNSQLAVSRKNYIQSCYDAFPILTEQMYQIDGIVIRFPKSFPKKQALKYVNALKKISLYN